MYFTRFPALIFPPAGSRISGGSFGLLVRSKAEIWVFHREGPWTLSLSLSRVGDPKSHPIIACTPPSWELNCKQCMR